MRALAARAAILVAALLAGCSPPPDLSTGDLARHGTKPAQPAGDPSNGATPEPSKDSPPAGAAPSVPSGAISEAPQAPTVSATPRPTVYERLSGGVYVPRCAACGAVQPKNSTQCPACSQVLRPWRQELLCTLCSGAGSCDRCGDDRPCMDCDGQGACPFCNGSGKVGGERCVECNATGRCVPCQGDGWRETTNHDFGPYETTLPGICPTCVGGSGLCPDCGTLTQDRAGGTCLSCGGLGVCYDCGGTGLCPHDAGDGLCVICGGGGREVVDGDPPKRADRVWNLRRDVGSVMTGRVLGRPDPNVPVQITQGGSTTRQAFMRSQMSPLTYYLAVRDWTPETDGRAVRDLGQLALTSGFWALAQAQFKRAMAADPTLSSEAAAALREIGPRRTDEWLATAEKARKLGDRDSATLFLNMIHFDARGTPAATRADVMLLSIQRTRDEELKGLDDAAKRRIADEAKAGVERVVTGARLRLDRARKLVADARSGPATDPAIERLLTRADQAAYAAQRMVLRQAWREPLSVTPWPVKPELLVKEARLLRAEIATFHAVREAAGGRYEFAAMLARRAISLDAANTQAPKVLDAAELGLVRRGVFRGSPAPNPK